MRNQVFFSSNFSMIGAKWCNHSEYTTNGKSQDGRFVWQTTLIQRKYMIDSEPSWSIRSSFVFRSSVSRRFYIISWFESQTSSQTGLKYFVLSLSPCAHRWCHRDDVSDVGIFLSRASSYEFFSIHAVAAKISQLVYWRIVARLPYRQYNL